MPKKKEFEWCPRSLIQTPFHYALCTTEKGFKKALKKIKLPREQHPEFVNDGKDACVWSFWSNGQRICLVTVRQDVSYTTEQVHSMLTHEAVHLFQHTRDDIGEDRPSIEFEAYSIQQITQNLIESYNRQTKKVKEK